MQHGKGGALPKFGEWDVNNPASADGFTVIFAKARDEKKATGTAAHAASIPQQQQTNPMPQQHEDYQYQQKVFVLLPNMTRIFFLVSASQCHMPIKPPWRF